MFIALYKLRIREHNYSYFSGLTLITFCKPLLSCNHDVKTVLSCNHDVKTVLSCNHDVTTVLSCNHDVKTVFIIHEFLIIIVLKS